MFLIVVVVLFPLVYILSPRIALVALFIGIGWTFYQRTHSSSSGRKRAKRDRPDEPQYQAGYEN
jgi:hypothetical protein